MNSIKPKRSKKLPIIIAASIAVILIGAGAVYALVIRPSDEKADDTNTSKIDLSKPSEEAKEDGETTKEQTIEEDQKTNGSSDRATAPTAPAGTKAESGLRITNVTQSGSQVVVRVLIPVLTIQGTCELMMDGPGNASYKASAPVQATASSSTCAGFNIPISELSPGDWKVTVTLNNEKLSGSDTKDLTIK